MIQLIGLLLVALAPVRAHCPLCTAAAGAGVAAARFLGVDDLIVGFWFGAFILSTALWFNRVVKKKYFKGQDLAVVLIAFAATLLPMYSAGIMGSAQHAIYLMIPNGAMFAIDRLLMGILIGTGLFIGASEVSKEVKKRKGLLFPFQTIIFILATLAAASVLTWVIL